MEPPLPDRLRRADSDRGDCRQRSLGDLDPKQPLSLALMRRSPWRPHRTTNSAIGCLLSTNRRTPSNVRVLHPPIESGQFTSWSFGENIRHWGLLASFGTVGDCFDNAAMESFWARLQVELLNTRKWPTTFELAGAMADYIDNFYNVERRHSYLGNISPTEFETLWTSTNSIPQLA